VTKESKLCYSNPCSIFAFANIIPLWQFIPRYVVRIPFNPISFLFVFIVVVYLSLGASSVLTSTTQGGHYSVLDLPAGILYVADSETRVWSVAVQGLPFLLSCTPIPPRAAPTTHPPLDCLAQTSWSMRLCMRSSDSTRNRSLLVRPTRFLCRVPRQCVRVFAMHERRKLYRSRHNIHMLMYHGHDGHVVSNQY
jgi:hypothetical protein